MRYFTATAALALITLQVSVACNPILADQAVNILPNGGGDIAGATADAPSEWYAARIPNPKLRMLRDVKHPRSGAACLLIESEADYADRVSNNWAQRLRYIPRGQTVVVRGYIRTEKADAANICVQCWGPDGKSLIGFASTPVVQGTQDWKGATSERLVVPPETSEFTVRAALTGKGLACFDDVSVEIVGPEFPNDPGLASVIKGRIVGRTPLTKDTMLLSTLPSWNHGNVDNIGVANNDGGVRTLLAWPKPPAERVSGTQQMVLAIYARESRLFGDPGQLQFYEILDDWDESTSWNNQPRVSSEPLQQFDMTSGTGWKTFDVTSVIDRLAKSGHATNGVLLRFAKEDRKADDKDWSGYQFVSREGIGEWQGRRPVLLLVNPHQSPLADEKVPTAEVATTRTLSSSELLEYVEYLASLPDVAVRPVLGDASALGVAWHDANEASTKNFVGNLDPWTATKKLYEAQLPPFERFVAAYPLTLEGVTTMSSIVAWSYYQIGRGDDAERMAAAASRLGANTELSALVELNQANIESKLGKVEVAESRLRRVVAQIPPTPEDRRTTDIRLEAPLALADLLRDTKQHKEADRLYRELAERGIEWGRKHTNSPNGGESYFLRAYQGRMQLVMAKNPPDVAAAEKLIDEAQKRIPSSGDALRGILNTLEGGPPPAGNFMPMPRGSVNSGPERAKQEDSMADKKVSQ